jgi:hypothetical protein
MIVKPPKWVNVYPQGTTVGDEEQKFFIALGRHPKFAWRSVAAISKDAGLSKERVEQIIEKYFKRGLVFQSPKNEDHWGYWERVPEMLDKDRASIANEDQKDRIDDAMNCKVTFQSISINDLPMSPLSDNYENDPLINESGIGFDVYTLGTPGVPASEEDIEKAIRSVSLHQNAFENLVNVQRLAAQEA